MIIRVLLTVLRNVTVAMVKEELLKVLQLSDTLSIGSILLAEVLMHYVHRVLVSTRLLFVWVTLCESSYCYYQLFQLVRMNC